MQEMWVQFLGREDPLEKGVVIHSSILVWESHGQRSLVGGGLWGCKELDTTEATERAVQMLSLRKLSFSPRNLILGLCFRPFVSTLSS